MFERIRGDRLAPWIIVSNIGILAVLLLTIVVIVSSIREQIYHEYATSKAYADAQQQFKEECSKLTVNRDILRCFERIIETAREPQRAEEDLYAQKNMAFWAKWIAYITLFVGVMTIIVAAFSVALLIIANRLNRDALIASERAWLKRTGMEFVSPLRWEIHPSGEKVSHIAIKVE